jgi:hypothetical protein
MHRHYSDILGRVPTPPIWFDEVAVPRFEAFTPLLTWNIYANEAVLFRIECQGCARPFDVCMTWSKCHPFSLAECVRQNLLHYGDPPNIGCCDPGPTMNSYPRRVLEFWHRGQAGWKQAIAHLTPHDSRAKWDAELNAARERVGKIVAAGWDRVPELEVEVRPRWA